MKQLLIILVCIMMVMFIGYAVQKENLAFGPMAVLVDPLPPPEPPLNTVEEPDNWDDPLQANTGALRPGGW